MYCNKRICVKYIEVIHTSIIKQESELFRYIRAEYTKTYIPVKRPLKKLTLTLNLRKKNSSISNKFLKPRNKTYLNILS